MKHTSVWHSGKLQYKSTPALTYNDLLLSLKEGIQKDVNGMQTLRPYFTPVAPLTRCKMYCMFSEERVTKSRCHNLRLLFMFSCVLNSPEV